MRYLEKIILSVKLYNLLGKKIMTLSPNRNAVRIESNNLKSGLYFAQITMSSGNINSIKLLKKY